MEVRWKHFPLQTRDKQKVSTIPLNTELCGEILLVMETPVWRESLLFSGRDGEDIIREDRRRMEDFCLQTMKTGQTSQTDVCFDNDFDKMILH